MSQDKAKELLESISQDRQDKIILEIESLKPWKYSWLLSLVIQSAFMFYITFYMPEDSIFVDPKFILVMLVILLFGSSNSDIKVHKRIDALLQLIDSQSSGQKNT
ncbi:hypothetical protein [Thalassotalea marina]|uniref:Uncharacterized protein n=1 Tax=Thalassotalea marina TaxID=1673741 RepID=A0A919EME2_9GAMM|nr:hypothetical protein [Thalassotalea marina]GHF98088.1 hypothetical protein GCM10017161_28130 [Thalassotalea marina]